jgi:hypothetical protein
MMNPLWLRLLGAGALALTTLLAHAQYSWIDDKGMRVFSDRPPPAGTPPDRILKRPRGLEPAQPAAPAAVQAPASMPGAQPAVPDWIKREEEFKKRTAERDKAEMEAEAKRRAALTERCASARIAQAQLNSGTRLVRFNKNGEKEYLSDEDRAREDDKASRTLAECR